MAARRTTRVPMPIKMRAKQFAMFDALKGLTEAIAEKEQQYYPKREIAEDRAKEINDVLGELKIGDRITVSYYCQYGKAYKKVTGVLKKIDCFWKEITIANSVISLVEISSIEISV